jgi:mRNA-degrading endonuclease RelE of RelBE toxin-antitoxin system
VNNIEPLDEFNRDFKELKKKYKNIAKDLMSIEDTITNNPKSGISMGNGFYKIRIKNSDKNKGKSAGYRLISYYIDDSGTIFLVMIYDKSELSNVAIKKLQERINRHFNN